MTTRDLDVVLFGATGFTGRLVAEQLALRAPSGTRIGLAGRSLARLGAVRDSLGEVAADWPLLLADVSDPVTMNRLARSTRALASTVGPYLASGIPLVEACARAGTHYTDLTGEVLFMRASIDAADVAARASGARIVHACGFDSIPSDLGVLVLHDAVGALGSTTLLVRDLRGGYSGGTIASLREQMAAAAADPAARQTLTDPYSLSPDRSAEPDHGDEADLTTPVHDPELGWLAPFIMASANTRVVRRSNALTGFGYSREFHYREAMGFGDGISGRARATGITAGLGTLYAAMGFGPTRAGLGMVLPKQGEGPSAEDRAAGHFRMEVHAATADGSRHMVEVGAQGDPGYAATSLMLAESVLLAALGEETLPDRAGVLTPATGLGMPLVERLRAGGMTFRLGDPDSPDAQEPGDPVHPGGQVDSGVQVDSGDPAQRAGEPSRSMGPGRA